MGEEEKICEKNKSFYLYCVPQPVHPFDRKHSFIREKKHKKVFISGEEEKFRKKNKRLRPLLCYWNSSSIFYKTIFRSGRRTKDLREEQCKKNKSFNLYCVLDTFHLSSKKHSFIIDKKT